MGYVSSYIQDMSIGDTVLTVFPGTVHLKSLDRGKQYISKYHSGI